MKIEIRIGDSTKNERVKYSNIMKDDIDTQKKSMYDFLYSCNDCVIEDVDVFLLYALDNCLMAYIVENKPNLFKKEYHHDEYYLIPKLNPNKYRIFEIYDDGTEHLLQDQEGRIIDNYFNTLMGKIMDDYYSCLNLY